MTTEPKRKRLRLERHISTSVFKSIGLLIVMASTMEFVLANALLRLIGTSRSGAYHAYPLVTGMDFKVKISLIRIFTKMYNLSHAKQINSALDKIDKLFGIRNTIAHSLALPGKKRENAKFQDLRAKIKLGSPPQPRVYSDKFIREAAIQMRNLADELNLHLTESEILTATEYDAIEILNRLLDLERAQTQGAGKATPTTRKKPPERPS